ncbi:hypothetical protein [Streptomyces sp. 8L]|uniref:hypothetical protein n=1 Tax=Streptomyces sp. 8L TaxID=2877242 RepID=UPI001CD38EAB|nr:hypothetical protein [Streptomyces sp. 8L]MCA1222436.1 hypothetical protein [Streptomyces sp. 8L]
MPDQTPADVLRAAAAKLTDIVAKLPTAWGDHPWHTEDCNDTDDMSPCPCIVAQGEYRDFDEPQIPPVQYVADAENPELADYIATMDPSVGRALADWLEREAAGHQAVDNMNALTGELLNVELGTDGRRTTITHSTLPEALARQVLGTQETR